MIRHPLKLLPFFATLNLITLALGVSPSLAGGPVEEGVRALAGGYPHILALAQFPSSPDQDYVYVVGKNLGDPDHPPTLKVNGHPHPSDSINVNLVRFKLPFAAGPNDFITLTVGGKTSMREPMTAVYEYGKAEDLLNPASDRPMWAVRGGPATEPYLLGEVYQSATCGTSTFNACVVGAFGIPAQKARQTIAQETFRLRMGQSGRSAPSDATHPSSSSSTSSSSSSCGSHAAAPIPFPLGQKRPRPDSGK